ncbi:ABC-2 type transport system ATP-binding protein [Thermocatellispora tengchongensis]|uniref:ABC-2 type transport system ATP-binding protein n=1 Tax=Thermocatellispora tengchongensis TaxID=1073253 RepID=A0A840NZ79_9ACTN|nr:ABC transporter ATP-binding protein [Thermocatellispora tengchongensis]MBB5132069.1 ABC-2 type transport system ATP-binding protein [Thermocatellispora tengchongensis]
MIEIRGLTKRYGDVTAVADLTFDVRPGLVTGFLGPNGAGKSTTMRMILGLDAPTSGTAGVYGVPYADLPSPMRQVGALLDARAGYGGRSARTHLRCLAAANGIPRARVDEVLGIVGLEGAAGRRIGGFSLGMSQRLGIAAALLGDPGVLIFDEPVNGLDPEGIVWIRTLMRDLAAEGRTVLVSSHLMSEMALTADHLIVIGRGRLVADASLDALAASAGTTVHVRAADQSALTRALTAAGATVTPGPAGALEVSGLDAPAIGGVAAARGLVLHELTPHRASLEETFMKLTRDTVEFGHQEGAKA